MRLIPCLFLLLTVSLSVSAEQDSLRAELDREQVSLGDSVTLTLTQLGGANMPRPDLSPLSEDFQILGTSQRSSTRWTGGRSEATSSWVVVLEPRRLGELSIPSLQAGDASSPPLSLLVKEAAQAPVDQDVFLSLTVEPEQSSYRVGQQLRVTLALFHAIPLATGELTELEVDGARVQRLGEDEVYESRRGQRVYRVIERRYAVVPERSGSLEIPSLRFSGRAGSRTSSFFGDRGRLVSARTEARELQIDRAAGEHALAARSLTLEDSLDQQPLELHVGEAISREISLRAEGVHADQLPDMAAVRIDGLRSYVDQPLRNTGHQNGWLQAEQRQRLAVIAMQPGSYQLPPIRVEWFNVLEQRNEVTELPARTLTVLPAVASAADGSSAQQQIGAADAGFWPWLSAGLGLLWLATLGVMLWNRRQDQMHSDPLPSEEVTATLRYARRQLANAARSNDHEGCQEALMMWNRAERLGCRSLSELAERVEAQSMAEAIRQLDRARFGPNPGHWQAPQCFLLPPKRLGRASASTADNPVLPPLYQ